MMTEYTNGLYKSGSIPRAAYNFLNQKFGFKEGEKLELLYVYGDIYVGITNLRIIKLQPTFTGYDIYEFLIVSIDTVKHEKNGYFSWDKLCIVGKDGLVDTFGIYHGDACREMCAHLEKIVDRKNGTTEKIESTITKTDNKKNETTKADDKNKNGTAERIEDKADNKNQSTPNKCNLYVLKCAQNKFYVGKTYKSFDERFVEHLMGEGSEWTKKYPPEEVVKSAINADPILEDAWTLMYMRDYGIENVRGGSYCRVMLSSADIEEIKKKLNAADDKCNKCGASDHWAKHCDTVGPFNVLTSFVQSIFPGYGVSNNPFVMGKKNTPTFENKKNTHTSENRKNTPTFENKKNTPTLSKQKCQVTIGSGPCEGSICNLNIPCRFHEKYINGGCTRCGRMNHEYEQCYARTHVSGKDLRPKR